MGKILKSSSKGIILDNLDRRLIRELDRNCRQSYTSLSRELKTPAETLRYRINALVEKGIIYTFVTIVDAGKLGCSVHKVLFKLHNVDEARIAKIIKFLVDHQRINWVARFDGLYDISFTIWATEIGEVSQLVDTLKNNFHPYINRLIFAVNIEAEFLSRNPVQRNTRRQEKQALYTAPTSAYRFDRLDLDILKMLAAEPRITATAIAEKINISSETVGQRIRNLEREKVITGYRLVIDCAKVEEVNYYVLIYLQLVSTEKIQRFVDYCRKHPLVNYIIKALGEWDYELNIEARDVLEYRSLMMELTREFSDIVRDYYGLPVTSIHKFMIMPPGALPRT